MTEESAAPRELTRLLVGWGNGDEAALARLMPLVYDELRRLARHYMRRERPGHTIQPTALVNEAYLRLVEQKNIHWQNRAHFFGIAANVIRRVLCDHARASPTSAAAAPSASRSSRRPTVPTSRRPTCSPSTRRSASWRR